MRPKNDDLIRTGRARNIDDHIIRWLSADAVRFPSDGEPDGLQLGIDIRRRCLHRAAFSRMPRPDNASQHIDVTKQTLWKRF